MGKKQKVTIENAESCGFQFPDPFANHLAPPLPSTKRQRNPKAYIHGALSIGIFLLQQPGVEHSMLVYSAHAESGISYNLVEETNSLLGHLQTYLRQTRRHA